jgi:hypothetical protein
MPLSERTERGLEACYDAVLSPQRWGPALQLLAESVGDAQSDLGSRPARRRVPAKCNAFVRAGYPSAIERQFSTEEERRTLPYFQETARPANREWLALAYFSIGGGAWCLPLYRGDDRGPFTPEDAQLVGGVGPYLPKLLVWPANSPPSMSRRSSQYLSECAAPRLSSMAPDG